MYNVGAPVGLLNCCLANYNNWALWHFELLDGVINHLINPYNVWGPHGIIYVYVCIYKIMYVILYIIRTIYDIIYIIVSYIV